MGLLDDIWGTSVLPEEEAPPQVDFTRPEPDPDVRAAMDREWGLPPTAPVQPEAPLPESANGGSAPGFAAFADMQAEANAPKEEPGDFSSYLETKEEKTQESPLKAFDLSDEEKAVSASPVPESVSGPDLQAQEADRLRNLAANDPIAFQAEMAQKADEEARHFAERTAEEEEKVARDQADKAASFKTAIADTQTDMAGIRQRLEEVAKRKPEDYGSSEWNAGKVFGLIKAIAIGLVSPMHGLIALNGEMKKDRERQEQAIQGDINVLGKQAGLLGEELALHGDLWKAQQTVSLAQARAIPPMIAAERAKYDKNGSIARSLVQTEQMAIAQAAAAEHKFEGEILDRRIKQNTEIRNQAKEQREAAEFARKMAPRAAAPKMSAEYIKQNFGIDVPGPMSQKDLDVYLNTAGKVQKLQPSEVDQVKLDKEKADLVVAQEAAKTATTASEIIDPVTKAPMGRAGGGPEAAKEAKQVGHYYVRYRNTMQKIADILLGKNKQYGGPGSERFQTVGKTKINTLRQDAANQLAKLRDPTSVNRDSEVAQALKEIPDFNGWTEQKNPIDLYKIRVEQADDEYNYYLNGAIPGFDETRSPTLHFKQNDDRLMAPSVKPAEEAPEPDLGYDADGNKLEVKGVPFLAPVAPNPYPQGPRDNPHGLREPVK